MSDLAPPMPSSGGPGRGSGGGRFGGDSQPDLTSGPILKTLVAFSIPTLLSNVAQSLNGSVNSVWVGQFLGERALAATANANIIMFLIMSTVFGFGMASTVRIGHAIGRGDLDSAKRSFGTAMGFCGGLTIIVAAGGWFLAPKMLDVLGTPAGAYDMALAYLRVIFLSMPFVMLSVMVTMALRGAGDAITPLKFMLLTVAFDIALNPVFIRGLGPAPRMGIAGSAFSSALANLIGLTAMIAYTYIKKRPLRLSGREFRYLIPEWEQLKFILLKGMPMGAQMLVVSAGGIAIIGLINREGVLTTAAYGAASQLQTYIQMPAMAIGAGVSAMAAQNIGAGRLDRLHQITRSGIFLTVGMTAAMTTVMLAFDKPALMLFLGSDGPAVVMARHIQWLSIWSFSLFAVAMTLFATMRANGAVMAPLAIMAISLFVVRLAFYELTYSRLGPDAIWLSFPVSSAVATVLAVIAYRRSNFHRYTAHPAYDEAAESSMADGEVTGRMNPSV